MLTPRFYCLLLRVGILSALLFSVWLMLGVMSVGRDFWVLAALVAMVILAVYGATYGVCRWMGGGRKCFRFGFIIRENFFRALVRVAFPAVLPVVGLGMWLLGFGPVTIGKFLAGFVFLCVVEYQGVKAFWARFNRK